MNTLNYPVTDNISQIFKDYPTNVPLDKSGIVVPTIKRRKEEGLKIKSNLSGKLKFILGFIYFFTLLFSLFQLLT